jgi:predicted NAD/FAD-dependent oxidoreductase
MERVYGSFVLAIFVFERPPAPPWNELYAVQILEGPFHVAVNETWPLQMQGDQPGVCVVKLLAGGRMARQLMESSDQEILSSAREVLARISPDLRQADTALVQRWPAGLPYWPPGQLREGRLDADFDRIQLAGDYLDFPNTSGAVRSGLRAAGRMGTVLGLSERPRP